MKQLCLFGVLLGLAAPSVAYGGLKSNFGLVITNASDGSGSISGTMADVRSSDNDSDVFFCTTATTADGKSGMCAAEDSTGTIGICWTNDPALVDVMGKIQGDESLLVVWNSSAECTSIQTYLGSQLTPKQP
jgi:hypothetical protein